MVDTKEIMKKLDEEQRQERIKRFKGVVKMTLKDLKNLIKTVQNSGLEDIKIIDLKKILGGAEK